MNDLDARIQAELTTPPLEQGERDALWHAMRTRPVAIGGAPRPAQRRRRPSRALVLATVLVLAVSGAALAAGTGVVERVFGDGDPTVKRVDQFAKPARPVTQKEYDQIEDLTWIPNSKRLGILKQSEMKQQFKLAPIEDSRVIVDDPSVGRVIGVPTADGSTICMGYSPPSSPYGVSGTGGCVSDFPKTGLSLTLAGDGTHWAIYGLAADDVDGVQIKLTDGTIEDAALIKNAFYWEHSSSEAGVLEVSSTRNGRTIVDPDSHFIAEAMSRPRPSRHRPAK